MCLFQTNLALASTNPEVADLLGLGEGLVPSDHGSVLILSQCEDVSSQVTFRPTDVCFRDLPVYYNGEEYYRNPKTFILQSDSTQVDCKSDFSIHRIGPHYFKQVPNGIINVTDSLNITILNPKKEDDNIFDKGTFQTLGSIFGKIKKMTIFIIKKLKSYPFFRFCPR